MSSWAHRGDYVERLLEDWGKGRAPAEALAGEVESFESYPDDEDPGPETLEEILSDMRSECLEVSVYLGAVAELIARRVNGEVVA